MSFTKAQARFCKRTGWRCRRCCQMSPPSACHCRFTPGARNLLPLSSPARLAASRGKEVNRQRLQIRCHRRSCLILHDPSKGPVRPVAQSSSGAGRSLLPTSSNRTFISLLLYLPLPLPLTLSLSSPHTARRSLLALPACAFGRSAGLFFRLKNVG